MTNSIETTKSDPDVDAISNCSTEKEEEIQIENAKPDHHSCISRSHTLVDIRPHFFPEKIGGTYIDSVLALDASVSPLTHRKFDPNQSIFYKRLIDMIDLKINVIISEKNFLNKQNRTFRFFNKQSVNLQAKVIAELTLLKQIINTLAQHAACQQNDDMNNHKEILIYALKLFLKSSNSRSYLVVKNIVNDADEEINLKKKIKTESKYDCLRILVKLSMALNEIDNATENQAASEFLLMEIPLLKKCLQQKGKKYKRVLKENFESHQAAPRPNRSLFQNSHD